MKQTQNSGNFACKFSISPSFARLKNLLSTKRARTIATMFAFFASLLSLCFLQNPSFASVLRTPATYLNISTSTPNVDFQFNQSELSSSAFKTNNVTVNIQTDNATGATTYISSVDEATSLVHSDSGVSDSMPPSPRHSFHLPFLARLGATALVLSLPRHLTQFQKPALLPRS